MANISAADVAKLRQITGAGMMDCKQALTEADGDFQKAIEILRKKGQKVANKKADREAKDGIVLATVSDDKKRAYILSLNCETDFVARNEDFVKTATKFLEIAKNTNSLSLEDLLNQQFDDKSTIKEKIVNLTAVIGEKIDMSFYKTITGEVCGYYVHSDKKIATIIALNKVVDDSVIKDIAMQITAMNPIAIEEKLVPQEIIDKELEIGREQAINEGKPADIAEKIAKGKLAKFFKDNVLVNQDFIKDSKITVKDYLASIDKELKVIDFVRFSLRD